MTFNSLTFIAFFAIVLFLHRLPLAWSLKKFNLLIASYLFYAAWNPPFVVLLWLSTMVDWWAARRIHESDTQARRRASHGQHVAQVRQCPPGGLGEGLNIDGDTASVSFSAAAGIGSGSAAIGAPVGAVVFWGVTGIMKPGDKSQQYNRNVTAGAGLLVGAVVGGIIGSRVADEGWMRLPLPGRVSWSPTLRDARQGVGLQVALSF